MGRSMTGREHDWEKCLNKKLEKYYCRQSINFLIREIQRHDLLEDLRKRAVNVSSELKPLLRARWYINQMR
jgi:hypothetical protein